MSEAQKTARPALRVASAVAACALLGAVAGLVHTAWAEQVARTDELLRTVRRLESMLAAHTATTQPAAERGNASASPKPPAAASAASDPNLLARANALLDTAVASKRWENADAQELRPLLAQLSDADRDALLRRFAGAVNHHQFQVDTHGLPPF